MVLKEARDCASQEGTQNTLDLGSQWMGRLFGSQRLSDANWPAVFLFSTHQCHWFIWNYKKKFSLGKKGGEEKTHPVDARAWDMARLLVSLPNERVLSSRPEKGVIWPQQSILPCSSHWGSRLVALAGSIVVKEWNSSFWRELSLLLSRIADTSW